MLSVKLHCLLTSEVISSSPATTFFFVCSSSFYHTGLRDLPNLIRGLADLTSLFHLQMQFLMPWGENDHILRNPPKTGKKVCDFKPDLGPGIRAGKRDWIRCYVF